MSIYRRKSGRWAVLVDLDTTAAGRRRRRSLGTFPTRRDAEKAEREALFARDRGVDLSPTTVTVAGAMDAYLRDRATRCGAKTLEEYHGIADRYILPRIGSLTLAKLRPAHISDWQAVLAAEGGQDGQPISAKTVFHARSLLNGMLAWAVKMSLVGRNVVSAVDAPAVRRSEAKAFEADEIARVLDAARGTRWHSFIALAFALGARRGELLALKWPVVDFERGVVRIEGSLSQTKAGVTMKGTKTDRVRTVPLSSFALDALRRQKVAQAADRLAAGASYKDDGFVFADAVGRRITPWNASYAFGELARKGWDLVDTLARRATHRGDDDAGRRDRRALGSRNARSQLSGDDDDGLRASARGRDG